jgi:hypothetical protein
MSKPEDPLVRLMRAGQSQYSSRRSDWSWPGGLSLVVAGAGLVPASPQRPAVEAKAVGDRPGRRRRAWRGCWRGVRRRSWADEQRLGDLAVTAAVGDQGKRLPVPRGSGRAGGGQADGQQGRLRQSTWHRCRRRRSGSRRGRRAARRGWVPRRSTHAAGEQATAEQHHDGPALVHSSSPLLAGFSAPSPAAAGLG